MKAYISITGIIFVLITIAHVARMFVEPNYLTDPAYLALTLLTAGLAGWAGLLLWRSRTPAV